MHAMPCDDFYKSNKTSEIVLNHKQNNYTLNKIDLALRTFSIQFLYKK